MFANIKSLMFANIKSTFVFVQKSPRKSGTDLGVRRRGALGPMPQYIDMKKRPTIRRYEEETRQVMVYPSL